MPRKARDYKAEYARRKARGLARGLTLSQARGHPRPGQSYASGKPSTPERSDELEAGLKQLRGGASLKRAAREANVSEEKLRRYVKGNQLASFIGRTWVMSDGRARRIPMISGSTQNAITVPGFDPASKSGSYFNRVGRFLQTQDTSLLSEFEGEGVADVKGVFHPFETNPNKLFMWAAKDDPPFHEIYQIVDK
jgi:hypothetical protein